jgi:hypothetical protein
VPGASVVFRPALSGSANPSSGFDARPSTGLSVPALRLGSAGANAGAQAAINKALQGIERRTEPGTEVGRTALGQVLVPRVALGNAAGGRIATTAPGGGVAPSPTLGPGLYPAGVRTNYGTNYGALPEAAPRNALGIIVPTPNAPRIGTAQINGAGSATASAAVRAPAQINGSTMIRPNLRPVTLGGPAKPQPGTINGTDFRTRH